MLLPETDLNLSADDYVSVTMMINHFTQALINYSRFSLFWQMGMKSGMWNIRSHYSAGLLKMVVMELGRYKLDVVGVQEVIQEDGGTERVENYTFFYGEGSVGHQLGTGVLVHKRIISAVRRVEFIGDRM
jgi:hypothetical protein